MAKDRAKLEEIGIKGLVSLPPDTQLETWDQIQARASAWLSQHPG
jgi:hypothetical protein